MTRQRTGARLLGAARGKYGYLLLALIAFLATAPMIAEGLGWKLVLAIFGGGLLVAALHAARPGRRSLIFGLVVAAVEFSIDRLVDVHGSRWLVFAQGVLWLSAMTYVTVVILESVLDAQDVTLETLQAAFCAYLLLGLIWAFLFVLVQVVAPSSFHASDGSAVAWSVMASRRKEFMRLFIFSYSTLTGTGYGDVTPSSDFAQMIACLEAMTAQVYLAVVIARLVGLQASPQPPPRPATALEQRENQQDQAG